VGWCAHVRAHRVEVAPGVPSWEQPLALLLPARTAPPPASPRPFATPPRCCALRCVGGCVCFALCICTWYVPHVVVWAWAWACEHVCVWWVSNAPPFAVASALKRCLKFYAPLLTYELYQAFVAAAAAGGMSVVQCDARGCVLAGPGAGGVAEARRHPPPAAGVRIPSADVRTLDALLHCADMPAGNYTVLAALVAHLVKVRAATCALSRCLGGRVGGCGCCPAPSPPPSLAPLLLPPQPPPARIVFRNPTASSCMAGHGLTQVACHPHQHVPLVCRVPAAAQRGAAHRHSGRDGRRCGSCRALLLPASLRHVQLCVCSTPLNFPVPWRGGMCAHAHRLTT
jgi:hypothetical protein